jgi:hypothetical protein
MPGFDKTGPKGMGPMTGGKRGPCNPSNRVYGHGRGYRKVYRSTGRPRWMRSAPGRARVGGEHEDALPKERASLLMQELGAFERRIKSIESEAKETP